MKKMFDYADSVFPMDKWFHSMGAFEISGSGNKAEAHWRWFVSWKADHVGTVSTGAYDDVKSASSTSPLLSVARGPSIAIWKNMLETANRRRAHQVTARRISPSSVFTQPRS